MSGLPLSPGPTAAALVSQEHIGAAAGTRSCQGATPEVPLTLPPYPLVPCAIAHPQPLPRAWLCAQPNAQLPGCASAGRASPAIQPPPATASPIAHAVQPCTCEQLCQAAVLALLPWHHDPCPTPACALPTAAGRPRRRGLPVKRRSPPLSRPQLSGPCRLQLLSCAERRTGRTTGGPCAQPAAGATPRARVTGLHTRREARRRRRQGGPRCAGRTCCAYGRCMAPLKVPELAGSQAHNLQACGRRGGAVRAGLRGMHRAWRRAARATSERRAAGCAGAAPEAAGDCAGARAALLAGGVLGCCRCASPMPGTAASRCP